MWKLFFQNAKNKILSKNLRVKSEEEEKSYVALIIIHICLIIISFVSVTDKKQNKKTLPPLKKKALQHVR